MTPTPPPAATLDDLMKVDGKAELIGGRIVHFMPCGDAPNTVAFEIAVHLRDYARASKRGKAYSDGIGFTLPSPLTSGRLSFSPDAAYYSGVTPVNKMRFVEGIPDLAVEVRSENDYGPKAECEMAAKRGDYFLAGTQIVWDVDPLAETIAKYTSAHPTTPIVFKRGDIANAEPALPGWRLKVDDVFA
jgi:Uma2 family endonuclease